MLREATRGWGAVVWLLLVALMALGCAPSIRVNSDFDPTTDFATFSSWSWVVDAPAMPDGANTLTRDRIGSAIERTLAAKGYRQDATNPSFRVGFAVSTQDNVRVRTQPTTVHTTTWRGTRGRYMGWSGSTVDVQQFTEGTLIIDVVQPDGERLIWRGTGTTRLSEQRTPEQRIALINDAVSRILAQFPPQ